MKASVNALKTPSAGTSPAAGFRSDLPGDLRGRSVEEGVGGAVTTLISGSERSEGCWRARPPTRPLSTPPHHPAARRPSTGAEWLYWWSNSPQLLRPELLDPVRAAERRDERSKHSKQPTLTVPASVELFCEGHLK